MKKWRAEFFCYDGGHGWGETGATNSIAGIDADSAVEAVEIALSLMPGGWKLTKIEEWE